MPKVKCLYPVGLCFVTAVFLAIAIIAGDKGINWLIFAGFYIFFAITFGVGWKFPGERDLLVEETERVLEEGRKLLAQKKQNE